MPVVHIPDNDKYAKALGMLYRMGGIFWTRPTHVLVIGPGQYLALAKAGLVEEQNVTPARGGGKKKGQPEQERDNAGSSHPR
jgi:hypothetical protein